MIFISNYLTISLYCNNILNINKLNIYIFSPLLLKKYENTCHKLAFFI